MHMEFGFDSRSTDYPNKKYALLRNFIDPVHAQNLSERFQREAPALGLKEDEQVRNAPGMYNYIPFVSLMSNKTGFVSQVVGEEVMPTYTYTRLYSKGNVLVPHKDRFSSEIGISVNLSCSETWPFWLMDTEGNSLELLLEPGDAVIYEANELLHWREEFQGEHCHNAFLFYVRERGVNRDNYFDIETLRGMGSSEEGSGSLKSESKSSSSTLGEYVKEYKNILSLSQCEEVISEYTKCLNWQTYGDIQFIPMVPEMAIGGDPAKLREIDELLVEKLMLINLYYETVTKEEAEGDAGYVLFKIPKGSFTSANAPSLVPPKAKARVMFFFNDDYSGGGVSMLDNDLIVKPEAGSVVVHPGGPLFNSRTLSVTHGVMYIMGTWVV
jgi:hypothetical protein